MTSRPDAAGRGGALGRQGQGPGRPGGFGRSEDIRRPPIAAITALAAREAAQGRDLVDLGQAVLGLPPPRGALSAVTRYLDETERHVYSPDPGLPAVRGAVAAHLREAKGIVGALPGQVMLTCGANQAFVNALLTLTRPGDEVITFGPGYFDHDFAIRLAGAVPVEVGLVAPGRPDAAGAVDPDRFRLDLDAFEAALTPRARCVVLVSPGNPTGAVVPPETVAELAARCARRGLWLISDETYDLLTFEPAQHSSPAATEDEGVRERVVVLGSFSKIFGLAAWRAGYLHGPEELIEEAIKAQDALVVCAPVPSQRAAQGALREAASYTASARRRLVARRDALLEALVGWPALVPSRPEGATFVFARLAGEPDDVAYCRRLVTEAGVVAVPGSAFGPRGAGWIRLSYGNQPVDRLEEAARRMRRMAP